MRHEDRPINSQGWAIALMVVIGVLVLWSLAFYVHHTRYHSYRNVSVVSVAPLVAAHDEAGG